MLKNMFVVLGCLIIISLTGIIFKLTNLITASWVLVLTPLILVDIIVILALLVVSYYIFTRKGG